MREAIQSIFKFQQKGSGSAQKTKGFTLIELLVAIILAALVITPLLGFMVNLLATDRKEQAKSTTAQDMQSALDYIARDLEQAVYIYDGEGLRGTDEDGISDNLDDVEGEPLLAFWKRKRLPRAVDRNFEVDGDFCTASAADEERECNDHFVYSLVVYSLIEGGDNELWSNAARIARFETQDGIIDPNTEEYESPDYQPTPGFQLFDLGGGQSLEQAMNAWEGNVAVPPTVLVDYIDQTPPGTNNVPVPEDDYCLSRLGLDRDNNGEIDREEEKEEEDQKTPQELKTLPDNPDRTSFFACVDTERTLAQIYIRGNALARIQNEAEYAEDSPYFPESTITVDGLGYIE